MILPVSSASEWATEMAVDCLGVFPAHTASLAYPHTAPFTGSEAAWTAGTSTPALASLASMLDEVGENAFHIAKIPHALRNLRGNEELQGLMKQNPNT